MRIAKTFLACTTACIMTAAAATAQDVPAPLPGEEALFQEIPSVYGASKYEQKLTEAPSSVTIVTAAEIGKYGYRTLADILRSVRGLYVTYDRNYSYLGIRGFNRPGDYNTRILLLVDGHRTNDNIFNQAFLGTDFILDVDLIEQVEIIRGPSSSIYGSNAFFGVINVITKRGRSFNGTNVAASAGSNETYTGRVSYGQRSSGSELLLSGSAMTGKGVDSLFFPIPPPGVSGYSQGMDDDRSWSLFGKQAVGDLTISGALNSRTKQIPTAPYGTLFNGPGTRTTDERGYLDLKYQKGLDSGTDVLGRLYYDYYRYIGGYLFAGGPNRDESLGGWGGGELQFTRRFGQHRVTAGGDIQYNGKQEQRNFDLLPYTLYLDDQRHSTQWALFAQDDWTITKSVSASAGVRYDKYDTFGDRISPRLALIVTPYDKTTVKLLYGEAFRAPNAYESYYHDGNITSKANPDLKPEKIRTYEIVCETAAGEHLLFTIAGFKYTIDNIISQVVDPADTLLVYRNVDKASARGVEFELDGRWSTGYEGRASYIYQEAVDQNGELLTNSPRQLAKLNLIAPVMRDQLFAGAEMQYTGRRKTIAATSEGSFVTANLNLTARQLAKGLELSAGIYNLFDKKYADPASSEHVQNTIGQDGRTYRIKVSYAF